MKEASQGRCQKIKCFGAVASSLPTKKKVKVDPIEFRTFGLLVNICEPVKQVEVVTGE